MKQEMIPVGQIVFNTGQLEGVPKNPRMIKDERYRKLVKSIQDDPEMLELRELIVMPFSKKDVMPFGYVCIAGNQRLKVMKQLGYTEAPCKVLDIETPPEKIRAYIIKDNVNFGEEDWDLIQEDWDMISLQDWGFEFESDETESDKEDLKSEEKIKQVTLKIIFENTEQLKKAEIDIQEILDRKYKDACLSIS